MCTSLSCHQDITYTIFHISSLVSILCKHVSNVWWYEDCSRTGRIPGLKTKSGLLQSEPPPGGNVSFTCRKICCIWFSYAIASVQCTIPNHFAYPCTMKRETMKRPGIEYKSMCYEWNLYGIKDCKMYVMTIKIALRRILKFSSHLLSLFLLLVGPTVVELGIYINAIYAINEQTMVSLYKTNVDFLFTAIR